MLHKRWIETKVPDEREVAQLKTAINASGPLAKLLIQRGFNDFYSARAFFNPSIEQLHNPFQMKDMDLAIARINRAIEERENILVYGDYDVDGTTSVTLLYSFLVATYERVGYYIPDRYLEGYGVSIKGIDFAADNEVTLIIALDCGIKAVDQVKYAVDIGIDFIICDHHLPSDIIPEAVAILNPLQPGCDYPYKHLSGCGIGFKLIQGLSKSWGHDPAETFKYLDLVAIAAACDIVPMTGENRVLTYLGIRMMERSLRPGMMLLFEDAGLADNGELVRSELSVSDIVFKIGPRINAAGRMEHGQLAVELLTAPTRKEAARPAKLVNANNENRKEVDLQILEEALQMIQTDPQAIERKSTMLYAEHWHKGVIGIVASRLQDHIYRPTVILCESNGQVSGSARSVRGFDIHDSIEECADLLLSFGGHPAAAGMTLERENVEAFRHRFEEAVVRKIKPEQLQPCIDIDLEIKFDDITASLYENLQRMAPFGPENMKPMFVSHNVRDSGGSRLVGDGSHLKFELRQEGNSRIMKGIGFGLGAFLIEIRSGKPFSLVYSVEKNQFRGLTTIELMVRDVHLSP